MSRILAALLALLLMLPIAAPSASTDHSAVTFDPAKFDRQRAAIEQGMRGDTYSELTTTQRQQVRDALREIQRLLDQQQAVGELREEERVALFNAQEEVNTLLTKAADDSRLLCKREAKSGSHLRINVCRTVAQIRRERESSENAIRWRLPIAPIPEMTAERSRAVAGGG
jgi:hypothetical protein